MISSGNGMRAVGIKTDENGQPILDPEGQIIIDVDLRPENIIQRIRADEQDRKDRENQPPSKERQ